MEITDSYDNSGSDDENREVFRRKLKEQRLRQLEALENKLAGFAGFNRDQENNNVRTRKQLVSIENIRKEDVRNNNDEEAIHFNESPSFVKGTMRGYQIEGLNWMISLHEHGLNGILADEMGLGKTIQSISMIGYLKHECKRKGPFLIVTPLTTMNNWLKELATFLPSVKVLRAHATGDGKRAVMEKLSAKRRTWDVAVTSYEFIVSHRTYFQRLDFDYAIIDEGHRAKNEHTLFPGVLRRCNIQGMILLTGTPIHNNLHELWALLNLLMPLFFNSAANFDSWFKVEDMLDPQHEQAIRLQNLLKPVLLRRTKKAVAADIPPKVYINISIPPTEQMCHMTHQVIHRTLRETTGSGDVRCVPILSVFPHLRKVVQHPFLVPGGEPDLSTTAVTADIVEHSAKMIVLDQLLNKLHKRGSKVLIFSQYVTMLNIIADYCDWREYEYCSMVGGTNVEKRTEQMNEFNRPGSDKFAFLLSTRAGGLGINLFTADTVIFYDMDFNPQMDFQAEDRAHRIGQTRKVHIFRLLVRGSIDELLYHTAERKRQLDMAIIGDKHRIQKDLKQQAYEYTRTSFAAHGVIDKTALDACLNEVFQKMGRLSDYDPTQDSGLDEECSITVPGVPCDLKEMWSSTKVDEQSKTKRSAVNALTQIAPKRRRNTGAYSN